MNSHSDNILKNEITLVTGASRGIGAGIAKLFGESGSYIIGTATTQEGADAITQRVNNGVSKGEGVVLDVSNSEDVNRNSFYGAAAADSYIEPILNDGPSLVKTFNTISYEGDTGWELDFLRTDLSDIGTVPTNVNCFDISLKFPEAPGIILILFSYPHKFTILVASST